MIEAFLFTPDNQALEECFDISTTGDGVLRPDKELLVQIRSSDIAVDLSNQNITVTISDSDGLYRD